MKRWGVRECMCALELFTGTGSVIDTQHGFCHEINQHEASSPNTVHQWIRQWCEEGSVTYKKPPGGPSSVHTPKNTAWKLASVGHSPRQSTSKHTQALCMSDRSVQHILHTNSNLHPYKLQIVHSLSDQDKQVHLQFCHHFQAILTENPDLPKNLLMSDEAHFHWHGTVTKLNYRY